MVYCRKCSVFTTFTARFRVVNDAVLIDLGSYTLYTKVKADDLLKNVPVIGPSLTKVDSYETVGDSDQYIDYVNLHLYQANRWPGNNGWSSNGYGSITWALNWLARFQLPSAKPVQATEAGYNNDIPRGSISEYAEGKYTARMFAEFFRRGFTRTYKYELVSQGQLSREGVFGLLRNDLSEKPAFLAVKNLISILSDKGPDFEPDSLNYVVEHEVNNLQQVLLQKRNGDFYLMLWLELASWDINATKDEHPPAQRILLTLLSHHDLSNVTLYAFTSTSNVTALNIHIVSNQMLFDVTDRMNILKLSNRTNSISDDFYLDTRHVFFSEGKSVDAIN